MIKRIVLVGLHIILFCILLRPGVEMAKFSIFVRGPAKHCAPNGFGYGIINSEEMIIAQQSDALRPTLPAAQISNTQATLWAYCDDVFELCLNGNSLLSGDFENSRGGVKSVELRISNGDKITARITNRQGPAAFAAVLKLKDGRFVSTIPGGNWKVYCPAAGVSPLSPKAIGATSPCIEGGTSEPSDNVSIHAGELCQGIWSDTGFLVLTISEDLFPALPNAFLHACGDDYFEVCINGTSVMTGHIFTLSSSLNISPGDVITVRVIDAGGLFGFAAAIQFRNGSKILVTNIEDWKSFAPPDEKNWRTFKTDMPIFPVRKGNTNVCDWKISELVGQQATTIWGMNDLEVTYLTYTVK